MRRSVSARIFVSFLIVMISFSGVIGYTVYRMDRVRRQLELISSCYLRLTLVLGELHTVQRNLLETLADRAAGRRASKFVRRQVGLASQFRLHEARRALQLVEQTDGLDVSPLDRQMLERLRRELRAILKQFDRNQHTIAGLFKGETLDATATQKLSRELQPSERRLIATVRGLRDDLRRHVKEAAIQVATDQRYGVGAGIALVVMALLLSVVMTWRARRTLRPLRTLVAGTQRIGGGDLAQRVPVSSNDELGALADEFNKMAEAIQEREQRLLQSERMAAAGMLASHITHEVRNPLNSISLNTEMLEEELVGEPGGAGSSTGESEARELCGAIRKEVDRLTEITEEYLRFARLPKPHLGPESVNDVVGTLLTFVTEELRKQGVEIKRALASDLPAVMGDDNQLRQAFLNLIRNAAEAMARQGGGVVTVTTALDEAGVIVLIADSGPGIEPERLRRIFEPFFSTKDHGTGLGLAITQRVIEEHGGAISAESEVGEGTVFRVLLPVTGAQDKLD